MKRSAMKTILSQIISSFAIMVILNSSFLGALQTESISSAQNEISSHRNSPLFVGHTGIWSNIIKFIKTLTATPLSYSLEQCWAQLLGRNIVKDSIFVTIAEIVVGRTFLFEIALIELSPL